MAKTSLEVFESEVKRLTTGKAGVQFGVKDEARRLKDGAHLAVASAQSRDAMKTVGRALMSDPKRLANFQVAAADRDPVLLAAMAGPRAMANLSGVAVADGGRETPLERIAARAARDHLALAAKDPAAAARREAGWQSQRNIMSRGFMAGAVREVSDTYVKSVSQTIAAANGGRAAVAPVPGWRPEGAFRTMQTLSPQLASARTPVQAVSRIPKEFRDNPALNRSRARAALSAQVADARSGVAADGVAFRQAFRQYYSASRNAVTRATDRVGAGIDVAISRAGRGRDAVVAGGKAARDGVRAGASAVGRGAAAGGRAVRDTTAAGGRAVRDGAAAGGRAVRDGAAAGGRAVRDGAASGARAVRAAPARVGRALESGVVSTDKFLLRVERRVAGAVIGGAVAVRTGVVNLVSRAASRVSAAIKRASQRAIVNPVSTTRFKKQLKSHMKQGPEATKSFLEKTLRSASGRAVALKAGLDPLTIAAAAGSNDLKQALSGKYLDQRRSSVVSPPSAPGNRYTTLGLSTPQSAGPPSQTDTLRAFGDTARVRAEVIERRLPTAVPPGASLSAAKARVASGSLQSDPEYRELREDLCARSAGYSGAGERSDTNFADHYEEALKLRNENMQLYQAGESRYVTDSGHPNHAARKSLDIRLDSVMEGGRNAKLVREFRSADFDEGRRAAVAALDDDWAGDRGGPGLATPAGADQKSLVTQSQRQYAAERIADLRLTLSPAAQDDARENGLASVKPQTTADRAVLRDIDDCRDTIVQYERGRGNPDYARDSRAVAAGPEAPSQARGDARAAGPAPAPAAPAPSAPEKTPVRAAVPAPPAGGSPADRAAASPAVTVPAAPAKPAVPAAQSRPQPAAAARPAPSSPAPAAASAARPAAAVSPAGAVPAAPNRKAQPSVGDPMVERKLASAIILRVAGKERRAANVIKQVVRTHAEQFRTGADREQLCRGAENHARVLLKGRKVPVGANVTLDPAKLPVPPQERSSASKPGRATPPAPTGQQKPEASRAAGAQAAPAKPVKPATRAPAGGAPTPKAPGAGASARAAGDSAADRTSGDSPGFAPPNMGALKRGGTSDRVPVARPSVAASSQPAQARKDKGQERASGSAQRS